MGVGGTGTVSQQQAQIPWYQSAIGKEYVDFLQRNGSGFQQSPYDLSYVSPVQRTAWGQAQQFGASGMQPFLQTLTNASQEQVNPESRQALYDVANRDFADRALALRTQAGTTGLSSSMGLNQALAKEQADVTTNLAQQLAALSENAANRRLQAAQLGLVAYPSALNALSGIGEAQTQPLLRQYQDWVMRNITAPLQAFTGSSGVISAAPQGESVVTQPDNTLMQLLGMVTPIALMSALGPAAAVKG